MISFVTALYKSDRYLPGYFKHLLPFAAELQRRNEEFEVIFVPQQPTALEKEMLASVSKEPWFRLKELPQPSLYGAWNAGVLEARGQFIGFWNADDWRYVNGSLEAVDLFKNGADLVYSPFRIRRYLNLFGRDFLVHIQRIDRQVPEFNERTSPTFLYQMHCGPFFMFRKTLYDQVGPFDEQFKTVADFEWCVRAAKATKKFVRAKQLIGSFRVDGRGVSAGGKPRHMAENNIVYIRHNQLSKHPLWSNTQEYMKAYDPKHIKFQDKLYAVDSNGMFMRS
jgi:glycosyltransferase involved in cell wall biosynthesis